MINKPPPFKGLNIRIPIIIPIKGSGFINQGFGVCFTWTLDVLPFFGFVLHSYEADHPLKR